MHNANFYHAHIYFEDKTRASAEKVRRDIKERFGGRLRIHGLIDVPIGPHPLPMFEVDIPASFKEEFINWLTANHAKHSVLIHPLTGDDLADHQDDPEWVGPPLKLRLDFLR